MMELQTRQNIVDMLCKSGGLVAFTAPELGLSERAIDRSKSGINIMKPVPPEASAAPVVSGGDGGAAMPIEPPTYQQLAAAYYGLGPPKKK
jgi:hypothetical protein